MKIERVLIVALLLGGAVWAADVVRTRIGAGVPAAGQLQPGEMATDTNAMNVYVGNTSSQAVLVGSASWSNHVTASVTNGLATTGEVAAAVSGISTNLTLWDGSTNVVLAITNGLIKSVTVP